VIAYDAVPWFQQFRDTLLFLLGEKAREQNFEGNQYYEDKSGFGFHGDGARKIVVCCSLGRSTTGFTDGLQNKPSSRMIDIQLEHGDLYVMSEKASGFDWKD
jgi:alkylated DNA repair dioxygenase AlkB